MDSEQKLRDRPDPEDGPPPKRGPKGTGRQDLPQSYQRPATPPRIMWEAASRLYASTMLSSGLDRPDRHPVPPVPDSVAETVGPTHVARGLDAWIDDIAQRTKMSWNDAHAYLVDNESDTLEGIADQLREGLDDLVPRMWKTAWVGVCLNPPLLGADGDDPEMVALGARARITALRESAGRWDFPGRAPERDRSIVVAQFDHAINRPVPTITPVWTDRGWATAAGIPPRALLKRLQSQVLRDQRWFKRIRKGTWRGRVQSQYKLLTGPLREFILDREIDIFVDLVASGSSHQKRAEHVAR